MLNNPSTSEDIEEMGEKTVNGHSTYKETKKRYFVEDECYNHFHYGILSMLLSWGLDPEIDDLVSSELGLQKPTVDISFGLMGEGGTMTIIFPSCATNVNRWNYSSHLTGLHSIAMVATFMNLMNRAKRDMR